MRIAEGMENLERGIPLLCFRLANGEGVAIGGLCAIGNEQRAGGSGQAKNVNFLPRGGVKSWSKKREVLMRRCQTGNNIGVRQCWRLLAKKKEKQTGKATKKSVFGIKLRGLFLRKDATLIFWPLVFVFSRKCKKLSCQVSL